VSYAGVLLILLGFVMLILEVKVTSHGVLGMGGVLSLLFGSLMLFDSPLPEMRVGLSLVLPVTLTLAGLLLFLVRLGVQAQRQPAVTGESGMLHTHGQALTAIPPGGTGRVATRGEIWTATAGESIHAGDPVVITAIDGLVLTVKRA
jgi:membrane-bound serine protease (ClpP class)